MTVLNFAHSGNMGDVLFSLHFMKDMLSISGAEKARLVLVTDVPAQYVNPHPEGKVQMTKATARFMIDLLKTIPWLEEVASFPLSDWEGGLKDCDKFKDKVIYLPAYRGLGLAVRSGDIRDFYYAMLPVHVQKDFSENLFAHIEEKDALKEKIVIAVNSRFKPLQLNLKEGLQLAKDKLVFMGLPEEYKEFALSTGFTNVPYQKINTLLEAAELMKGAQGFIGTQGGLYSLAEMLKVPRLLLSPEVILENGNKVNGPVNNHPMGGAFCDSVKTQLQFSPMVLELASFEPLKQQIPEEPSAAPTEPPAEKKPKAARKPRAKKAESEAKPEAEEAKKPRRTRKAKAADKE